MSKQFLRKEKIVMSIIVACFNFLKKLKFGVIKIFKKELRIELQKNFNDYISDNANPKQNFCFVLGNGPSLKRINNNMLINHDVFVVNFFFYNEWFNKLRSVFYFFTDPAIFGDCNKQKLSKLTINEINSLINNTSIKRIIIPFQRKKQWLQSFRSSKDMDKMRYYYSDLEFLSGNTELTLPNGNFCKGQTVVINALLYAMALGYKKIYLLGVDMTGFLVKYEQNSNFQEHSYEKTGSQIEYIDMSSEDNEFNLKIHGKMFEQFKYIKNIADRNNIKILNASPGGALDVFDRVDFEKIF